jgi:hypothetical protein
MYLVEIAAGREAIYDSVKALSAAIRRGEVGPHARIFHRASSSWISITLHPEYKRAAAARATEALPPLARKQWTFLGVEPKGREFDEPPATAPVAPATTEQPSEPRSGLRRFIRRAFRGLASTSKTSQPAGT